MEKIFKEIKRLKPGTYGDNRFLTQLFHAMETTTNESFERTVEVVKYKWIMGDPSCTIQYVISSLNTKFRNLEGAGVWNKTSENETKIIALTTALNDQKKKFKELETKINAKSTSSNSTSNSGGSDKGKSKLQVPEWRIKFKGQTTTHDNKRWVWCKKHKVDGVMDGMYFPKGHDHDEWQNNKDERLAKW